MSLPQSDVQGSLFESLEQLRRIYSPTTMSTSCLLRRCGQYCELPRAADGMLRGRQRPARSRAGGVVRGIDLPIFGKSARPASCRISEVSSGVETGAESEIEPRRFPPNNLSLLPPATDRTRQSRGGDESSVGGVAERRVSSQTL